MVVWGLNDRIVPVEAALSYHRLIPHSRLEIFERTGHVPQLERPARFNAAARGVPRVLDRSSAAQDAPRSAQPVIAPWEAEETVAAYLAITPRVEGRLAASS